MNLVFTICFKLRLINRFINILIHDLQIRQRIIYDFNNWFINVYLIWFIHGNYRFVWFDQILNSKIIFRFIFSLWIIIITRKDLTLWHIVFKLLFVDGSHFIFCEVNVFLSLFSSIFTQSIDVSMRFSICLIIKIEISGRHL